MKRKKLKKESFMKSVVVLMISQVFVKALGLVYKLYLTNKEGFGDKGKQYIVVVFKYMHYFLLFLQWEFQMRYQNLYQKEWLLETIEGHIEFLKLHL